jgi:hypothetical protein
MGPDQADKDPHDKEAFYKDPNDKEDFYKDPDDEEAFFYKETIPLVLMFVLGTCAAFFGFNAMKF